jgi:hypothetical protein
MLHSLFRRRAIANLIFPGIPMLLSLLHVIIIPNSYAHPSAVAFLSGLLCLTGFSFLFITKFVNFKKGILISFGCKSMSPNQTLLYRLAYALMIPGVLGIAAAIAV